MIRPAVALLAVLVAGPASAADSLAVTNAALTVYSACVSDELRADRSQSVGDLCHPELRTFMERCEAYASENPDLGDICAFKWAAEIVQVKQRFGVED